MEYEATATELSAVIDLATKGFQVVWPLAALGTAHTLHGVSQKVLRFERMHKKRGQSFYAEVLDPSAKKYLNKCNLCGRVGLSPSALDADYDAVKKLKTVKPQLKIAKLIQKAAVSHLLRSYDPLPLDQFGRCRICAQVAEDEKPVS